MKGKDPKGFFNYDSASQQARNAGADRAKADKAVIQANQKEQWARHEFRRNDA